METFRVPFEIRVNFTDAPGGELISGVKEVEANSEAEAQQILAFMLGNLGVLMAHQYEAVNFAVHNDQPNLDDNFSDN